MISNASAEHLLKSPLVSIVRAQFILEFLEFLEFSSDEIPTLDQKQHHKRGRHDSS